MWRRVVGLSPQQAGVAPQASQYRTAFRSKGPQSIPAANPQYHRGLKGILFYVGRQTVSYFTFPYPFPFPVPVPRSRSPVHAILRFSPVPRICIRTPRRGTRKGEGPDSQTLSVHIRALGGEGSQPPTQSAARLPCRSTGVELAFSGYLRRTRTESIVNGGGETLVRQRPWWVPRR